MEGVGRENEAGGERDLIPDSLLDELERRLDVVEERINVERVKRCVASLPIFTAVLRRVPADYYDRSLEERRVLLGAASTAQLCKTIVLENTAWQEGDDGHYVAVVLQYITKIDVEALAGRMHRPPSRRPKYQLAPEAVSRALTGFIHNAVTVFGLRSPLPVVVCQRVADVSPPYVYLGGGSVDAKLGLAVSELVAGAVVCGRVSVPREAAEEEG